MTEICALLVFAPSVTALVAIGIITRQRLRSRRKIVGHSRPYVDPNVVWDEEEGWRRR